MESRCLTLGTLICLSTSMFEAGLYLLTMAKGRVSLGELSFDGLCLDKGVVLFLQCFVFWAAS